MAKQAGTNGSLKRLLYSPTFMPYVFVSPFVLTFLIFFLYPTIETILMSFSQMQGFKDATFVGLDHYARLFNYHFGNAIKTNTIYTVLSIFVLIPLPTVLAVLLNSKLVKMRNAFRAAIFIPSLVSAIIAGIAFRIMFGDLPSSLFNQIIGLFGGQPIAWNMIYCLSALQSIPTDIYESAEIDGATPVQRFFRITVPLLMPTIAYIMTLTVIGGYRMFTESYVYWVDSTPGDIGLTIVRYIYQMAFQRNDMGFGSAIGIVLLFIIMGINMFQLRGFGLFGKEKD